MDFDSTFGLFEVSPLEKTRAKIYRHRIKRVEFSIEHKRFRDFLSLGKGNHIVGKLLKELVVRFALA